MTQGELKDLEIFQIGLESFSILICDFSIPAILNQLENNRHWINHKVVPEVTCVVEKHGGDE